ncbi:polysaccharide deacetylase family protein [Streptomyces cynarae]|uniref:Polysaccharide deacetylase family protein n=1 Tax=Streptomyces cynarae TaxID=2981134 RepID=A0ABY6ECD2_9ACTN|nr:polysaccharide deacetylase family protein [Streptomyces cynarae]UXY24225.1 polysaccharide deacetylase family protein [Streptomyces cynarae]
MAVAATALSVVVSTLGPVTATVAPGHAAHTSATHQHTVDCRVVRCVALTFDDGPTRYTTAVLRSLEDGHAVATFFLIGPRALQNRADVLREYRDGDAIGDHTVTHPRLPLLSRDRIDHEIDVAARQIASVTGHRPALFRPPFGAMDSRVPKAAGAVDMAVVLWNVSPRTGSTTTRPSSSGPSSPECGPARSSCCTTGTARPRQLCPGWSTC